jgi:hypothetical protein
VERTKVIRISRQPSPIRIMIENNRRMWNISTTRAAEQTNDATWIRDIKSSTSMERIVFKKIKLLSPANWA